ncbi:MAG: response regulator transcription factor [Gammaproteobacteria bacterium]|nr:response regulator transcription factor [Gammaproteobacteria bacterium]MBU1556242.1 response regulator transcription factor [Gammaproteobacteria bacterium]MBU2071562.1 response regulator transcription factor [Gammaproteobacteria bacterium]MBU2184052.1 response regulator transcription factor [Gammaproteobacteria bacterium]MBU2206862.1 response regulator transcription factor [Gammaproteobacteria bacterium]
MNVSIVLIDDQNLVREGIKSLLQLKPGFTVVAEAADGSEAETLVRRHQPDVLLLDIRMPKVTGLEVLQQFGQAGIDVPVLILTTFDDHELVLDCIKLGARGYLRKDVSFEVLTNAILNMAQGKSWLQPAVTCRVEKARDSKAEPLVLLEQLTDIELQVLRLVAAGYSNHEIAGALYKSVGTIRNQVSAVLAKLDVRDRTRAVLKALDLGLI